MAWSTMPWIGRSHHFGGRLHAGHTQEIGAVRMTLQESGGKIGWIRWIKMVGCKEHPTLCSLCFALEMSLKAFIALHGGNREALKEIGHDLVCSLAKARVAGYSPKHQAVPDLIAILGPLHVNHSLRYLEKESAELAEPRNMIAIVRLHVKEVGVEIATPT